MLLSYCSSIIQPIVFKVVPIKMLSFEHVCFYRIYIRTFYPSNFTLLVFLVQIAYQLLRFLYIDGFQIFGFERFNRR